MILLLLALLAPVIDPPHEMLGFLLFQKRAVFDATLGKPFHSEKSHDGRLNVAYTVGKTQTYLAATFNAQGEAVSLQITGKDFHGPTGFATLTLGTDAADVQKILGPPAKTRHENDENLDFWDFAPANYSLEFTADQKLYSISVSQDEPTPPKQFPGSPQVREFALAVQQSDVDAIMQMSSGDLSCARGADEVIYRKSARAEFTDPKGKLLACISDAARAIVTLGPEMRGAENQLRIPEKHGPLAVTKFPESFPVQEIVFTWEVQAWRIYEATLRGRR